MSFTSPTPDNDDLNALSDINVTPFIDVMLVLLIIFMVAAPLSTANIPLDLPSTSTKTPPPVQDPITVSLKNDTSLYVGDNQVSDTQFIPALDKASKGDKNARIFLRADKNIDYGRLMAFIDRVREGGYSKIALLGLPAEQKGNGK